MEVQFLDVAFARLHSTAHIKTDEMVRLPIYLGKRAARVRVETIPTKIDVAWLAAAIPLGTGGKVMVLQRNQNAP